MFIHLVDTLVNFLGTIMDIVDSTAGALVELLWLAQRAAPLIVFLHLLIGRQCGVDITGGTC